MKLVSEWVKLDVGGKAATGFAVFPERGPKPMPGIVLIQEAFGVDAFIQDVAQRLATAGYAVVAPDLFSYGGKPKALAPERVEQAKDFLDTVPSTAWFDAEIREKELAKLPVAQAESLRDTLSLVLVPTRPWDQYVATLTAGRVWLESEVSRGQRVGALGFCLGGALALRLGCSDPALRAAVVFYGASPPPEMIPSLQCPVLGLYAEQDPRITGALPTLDEQMRSHGKRFEPHVYPGTQHAFFNDTRKNFHAGASRDAWAKTLSFLVNTLAT